MLITGRISDARFTFITIQKTSVLSGATKRRRAPTWMDAALSTGVATVMDGKSKNTII
jgi:hypothetical protein